MALSIVMAVPITGVSIVVYRWSVSPKPLPRLMLINLVTVSIISNNWAQLPFRHHWKLHISSVPYAIEVAGG